MKVARQTDAPLKSRQDAIIRLSESNDPRAVLLIAELVDNLADKLVEKQLPPELELDVYEAGLASSDSRVVEKVTKWFNDQRRESDPLSPFQMTLRGGDPVRGYEIFFGNTMAQCGQCHRVGDQGNNWGPNLSRVGQRQGDVRRFLLESMIEPNAQIARGYGETVFELSDGETFSGVVIAESKTSLSILEFSKGIRLVARDQVEAQGEPRSIMTSVEKSLSLRQLRDLIEYMAQAK